ncbi:hypothetical protein [Citrobacter portucalensis]|uniref:hypothetical protein n=1 Tax=Citrobacter portucalensis TaxID=1639133 RepID=UPI002B23B45D|nr:hypothetical protein [Citrobacter portucalensis]MEB0771678.1 hypothetical protein [Citrobacter portucalensis]MEB0838470.1 hypothetical protein [Citrobacter portucalensis]
MQTINNRMTETQIADLFSLAVQLQVKSEESDDRDTAILAYSIQNACSNLTESQREFRAADATIHNLELKLTDLAVQLANTESKCRELAAENAHARERHVFIRALAVSILEHSGGRMDWRGAMEDATELLQTVDSVYAKTPATDAFLAEVRAQVWIEGSEPEEFGRYWVRYETDVGPQYCSAEWMEYNFCAGSNTNIHKIWLADHSRSINSLRGVTHYTKLPDSLEGAAQ